MADESRDCDIDTDQDPDAAPDAVGAETAAPGAPPTEEAGDTADSDAPSSSPGDGAADETAPPGDGRLAQIAARLRPSGLFWRFVVGVSALSVAALLVLAVIATAKAIFDDDHDDGWFAYSTGPGPDGFDFIGEAYHNGYGGSYDSDDHADDVRGGGHRSDDRRDKSGMGRRGRCDGERQYCRDKWQHRFGLKSDAWTRKGEHSGGWWSFGGPGLFGHHRPRPDFQWPGRSGGASPFGFFDGDGGPFSRFDEGGRQFGFWGGESGQFGLFDGGARAFDGPLSDLPLSGPLGRIPGFGEEELSELRTSCEQLEAELDDLDGDAESDGLPQIGIREFLLLVMCPTDGAPPPLFGGDDQATIDPDGDESVGPDDDDGGP